MSGQTRTRRPSRPRVVILGGGFAGLSAAMALRADRYEVVLVDRGRWFEWLPNIHELLSGVKTPELLRLPLADLVSRAGHRFVRDTVTRVDADERLVALRRRRQPLSYDALIVALGGVDSTRGVTGVVEHALPFKSVESCERIGRRLARLAARREPGRVVIVGGGLEGVEALGEILRRYRESALRIALVEAGPQLLPEAAPALDRHLRELCAPHAVTLETGHAVRRIEARAVVLDDGRSLPSDLTIWTGGPAPPALLAESGLAPAGAWAPVDVTLQSKGHPEVFVAGDAAELPTRLTKQAYHALDMGACAARNVERRLADRSLHPLQASNKPMLISFGDLSCFLAVGSFVLAGPALGALKEAIFEVGMTQLDAQPAPLRLPGVTRRAARATRCLLWPTLASPTALLRQARLSILSSR